MFVIFFLLTKCYVNTPSGLWPSSCCTDWSTAAGSTEVGFAHLNTMFLLWLCFCSDANAEHSMFQQTHNLSASTSASAAFYFCGIPVVVQVFWLPSEEVCGFVDWAIIVVVLQMTCWWRGSRPRRAAAWPFRASSSSPTPPTRTTSCRTVETARGGVSCHVSVLQSGGRSHPLKSAKCPSLSPLQAVPRQADRKHQPAVCGGRDAALQLVWDRETHAGQDGVYPFRLFFFFACVCVCWSQHVVACAVSLPSLLLTEHKQSRRRIRAKCWATRGIGRARLHALTTVP